MRISDWSSDVCSSDLLDASIFARFAVFSAMLSDRENSRVTRLDGDAISARSADDRLPEIVIVLDDMRETVATRAFGLDGLGIGNFVGHLQIGRASCRERVCQ